MITFKIEGKEYDYQLDRSKLTGVIERKAPFKFIVKLDQSEFRKLIEEVEKDFEGIRMYFWLFFDGTDKLGFSAYKNGSKLKTELVVPYRDMDYIRKWNDKHIKVFRKDLYKEIKETFKSASEEEVQKITEGIEHFYGESLFPMMKDYMTEIILYAFKELNKDIFGYDAYEFMEVMFTVAPFFFDRETSEEKEKAPDNHSEYENYPIFTRNIPIISQK